MPSREPVKFLLVDDLEENLLALEALLRRDGLELIKARSGAEALEQLLQHDFALALLDVQMGEMDGFELAELMRGIERTRRVPIIFLSAIATDERRRFRGYEAGAVDYLSKPLEPQILQNKAEVFFQLYRQRQELALQRDEQRQTAARLAEALGRIEAHRDNSLLAIVEIDPGYRVATWSKGAERIFGWEAAEIVGQRADAAGWAVTEESSETFAGVFAALKNGGEARHVHTQRVRRRDGGVLECEWYSSALRHADGRLISVAVQILDITERRRAQETQQLLIGELNHRVKNTLATVQAIAQQTLRHSPDPADFSGNFSGRLQALAAAHSLLSGASWQGAQLSALVQEQLRLGIDEDERHLAVVGPEVRLAAQPALHVALILHELGTNARKYGAWSVPQGQVRVEWAVIHQRLQLRWEESGGPAPKGPSRTGFGTSLIQQSIRAEGGSAEAHWLAGGVVWDIALPLPESAGAEEAESFPMPAAPGSAPVAAGAVAGADGDETRLQGRRLLVVEDEPILAIELITLLKAAGAQVTGPAGSANQALAEIARRPFDGVLLDGNLRGEPVHEVAAQLARRGVPFLFVTGYGRDSLPRGFASTPVLGKPFTQAQLLEAVGGLVGGEQKLVSQGTR